MLDTPQSKNKKAKRLIELDSLRGIACIGVMLFHYTFYYEQNWKLSAIVLAHPLYFFVEKPSYEFIKFRLAARKDARNKLLD